VCRSDVRHSLGVQPPNLGVNDGIEVFSRRRVREDHSAQSGSIEGSVVPDYGIPKSLPNGGKPGGFWGDGVSCELIGVDYRRTER